MAESGAAEGSPPSAHNVHPAETAVSATATATATGLPENHQDAADTPSDPPSEENGAVASEAAAEFNDDQGDQGEVEPGEVEPGEDGDGDGDGDGDSDGDGARDTSRFIAHGDSKSVAPRIKDSHWEAHKDKILKHYVAENNTLDALMEIMDREYSFKPSKRQYVHRIGTIWGVKKYKQQTFDKSPKKRGPGTTGDAKSPDLGADQPRQIIASHSKWQTRPRPVDSADCDAAERDREGRQSSHQAILPGLARLNPVKVPDPTPRVESYLSNLWRPGERQPLAQAKYAIEAKLADSGIYTLTTLPRPPKRSSVESPPSYPSTLDAEDLMVDTPQINPKRAKRSEKSEKTDETIDWPCPYRKRNPLRFNLNDHPSCALHPFQDIKTHIRDFHQLGDRHRCPRCKKVLLDSRQYDAHLQLPIEQMCALSSETPPRDFEDGITVDLDTLLARVSSYEPWATQLRGGRSAGVVHQWALLWAALFPEDIRVPSLQFEPVVEHFALEQFVTDRIPEFADWLKTRVSASGLDERELRMHIRNYFYSLFDEFKLKCFGSVRKDTTAAMASVAAAIAPEQRALRGGTYPGSRASPSPGPAPQFGPVPQYASFVTLTPQHWEQQREQRPGHGTPRPPDAAKIASRQKDGDFIHYEQERGDGRLLAGTPGPVGAPGAVSGRVN